VQISEVSTAAAGGSKTAWIADMFHDLQHQPDIQSVVWFDVDKQTVWRIDPRSPAAVAFAAGVHAFVR
jgi:hypothetical protein